MLGMKNLFDISGSIEICEVDIAGVACIRKVVPKTYILMSLKREFIIYWLQEEEKDLKNQYFGQGKIEFGQGKVREFCS